MNRRVATGLTHGFPQTLSLHLEKKKKKDLHISKKK